MIETADRNNDVLPYSSVDRSLVISGSDINPSSRTTKFP